MLALAGIQAAFAVSGPAFARGGRHAAMILDANTGTILHAEDADELRHPASLTKMMTLYLAFETLASRRMTMSDRITISSDAAAQPPSKLGLESGETISVSDAIRALVTKSANDVAVALAEKVGGSERNFVRLMNARARDLGMSKSNFENASGLPDAQQVTTARDMITLGLRLQDDFPEYYPLFATRSFSFNRASYRNHNTMLNNFQGIDGIKTGYTRMSGFNLVSSVRRGGRHVVGAVFGGASAATRNGEMRTLLTRALSRASTVKTRKPAPTLMSKLKSAPKLAERPKIKDAPKAIAQAAPQPKPFAPARPAAAPTPAPIQMAAQAPPLAVAPIDVFKVKRVIVAPRQGPRQPTPDETTDMSADDAGGTSADAPPIAAAGDNSYTAATFVAASADVATPSDALAATFATAEQPQRETVIPKTRLPAAAVVAAAEPEALPEVLPAPSPGSTMSMLGARDAQPKLAAATMPTKTPPRLALAGTTQRMPVNERMLVERGRAPSSLQAQAHAQAANAAPQRIATLQPAAFTPSRPSAVGTTSGRFEIQIGAFGSIDEAQRALSSAQTRAGPLLNGYASITHPVQKAGRQMYRARFSGFDAARASSTCTELRRSGVDCFVMSAE